jgi:hypothetical protein
MDIKAALEAQGISNEFIAETQSEAYKLARGEGDYMGITKINDTVLKWKGEISDKKESHISGTITLAEDAIKKAEKDF